MLFFMWKYSHATPKKLLFESPLSFPVRFPSPLWGALFSPSWFVQGLQQVLDPWTTSVSVLGFWGLWTWIVEFPSERSSWGSPSKHNVLFLYSDVLKGHKGIEFIWMVRMAGHDVLDCKHGFWKAPLLKTNPFKAYLLDSGWAWGLFSV